jgi:hypothetical protein
LTDRIERAKAHAAQMYRDARVSTLSVRRHAIVLAREDN